MKNLTILWLLLVALTPLFAQPLWTCDGTTIIMIDGDFYLNRTQIGDAEINLEPLPVPNAGNINGIAYRRTDNCIYGADMNLDGTGRLFRLTPDGEYEIISTITNTDFNGGFISATFSYDDRYLILSLGPGLYKIDVDNLQAPLEMVPYADGEIHPFADIALDVYTGKIHGFDLFRERFVKIDPNSGAIEDIYQLDPVRTIFSVPGLSFEYNQLAIGLHGNNGLLIMSFFHPETKSLLWDAVLENPGAADLDACSCLDFDVALLQTISQDTVQHCQTMLATILLSNRGEASIPGSPFTLVDSFPPGVTIDDVIYNPYGGTVSGLGTNQLLIEDFEPKFGVDSIIVRLAVSEAAELGVHSVQVELSGFLDELNYPEGKLLSDNPKTYSTEADPTPFFVQADDRLPPLEQALFYRCPDKSVMLNPFAEWSGYDIWWDDGSTEEEQIVDAAGVYGLTVTDLCNTYEVDVVVQDVYLDIDLGTDQTIPLTSEASVEAIIDSDFPVQQYQWYVDDALEENCEQEVCDTYNFTPSQTSWVELIVTEENGCIASDRVRIHPKLALFTPNAFSPNGDGANDHFYFQAPNPLIYFDFQVFDRWGGLIFMDEFGLTNDPAEGWDGTFQGEPLETGIYIWKIRLEVNGEPYTTAGEVMLVR